MNRPQREVLATLALSQMGVGPLGRAMIGSSLPVENAPPRRRRMPVRGPEFDVGDEFRVDDLTTGWTRWYRILTYLGFGEYRVRIDRGHYVARRGRRPRFRRAERITSRLGGGTLLALRRAGRV